MFDLYIVSCGNRYHWTNKHFVTAAAARAFYNEKINELRACYPGMKTQETITQDEFVIVNLKKNGKPGAYQETVRFSPLQRPCTYAFCNACRSVIG